MELRRLRVLESFYQQKNQRIKRIKSKKYHKLLKKVGKHSHGTSSVLTSLSRARSGRRPASFHSTN